MESNFAIAGLGAVFTVLWWLLRNKDMKQEKDIDLLFKKHDDDAGRLQALELEIAKNHYVKSELDPKFSLLESAFRSSFNSMSTKFDHLSENLISHLQREINK